MPDTYTTISELPDYGSVLGTDRIAVDRIGTAVTAGVFVVGQAYQIVTVGSTSFTAIGAASNTVGAYFVATAAGSGSGTAAPINTGDAPLSAVAALLDGGSPLYAITNTYTASGAISPTDHVAAINAANAVTMTLASGSSNGQSLLIKRFGAGAVTITANLDGASSSIVADSATIKESVLLAWSSSLATWLIL
jgi:hypothetical protein